MRSLLSLLYCLLFSTIATALQKCDDCVTITSCAPALQMLQSDQREEAYRKIRDALCDIKQNPPKVCCSNFNLMSRFDTENDNKVDKTASEDEIENHRNLHLLPPDCGDIMGDKIFGGVSAGLYEFPWLALIAYKEGNGAITFKCGGTVITARYVLTAAHCIEGKDVTGVRIGDYDVSKSEDCVGDYEMRECESKYQDIPVTTKIRHPNYVTVPIILNDIGLLRLATPVDFSYYNAATICLPITRNLRNMELAGETGTVAGWGATENQQQSNVLLKVNLHIHDENVCNLYFKSITQSRLFNANSLQNTICAGETGHDSCKGDSGGPLMVQAPYNDTFKLVQFGIVSYGMECASGKPGLYTDVRKYMKWILDTIKP